MVIQFIAGVRTFQVFRRKKGHQLNQMKRLASATCYLLFLITGFLPVVLHAQTPSASFTVSAMQGCAPMNVQFTNTSTGAVSWQWTFGNGNSSTLQHPGNVYSTPGNYTVTLTATSSNGASNSYSLQLNVAAPPVASFTSNITTVCEDYGVIQFQNTSTGYDSCVWDFGDGNTSTLTNPSHIYSIAGVFTVKLLAYNKTLGCSDLEVRNSFITIHPRPTAVLTTDTTEVCDLNHNFSFYPSVSGSVTSWLWNFGDGNTSSSGGIVNHTYSSVGNYIVSLTLQNSFGCGDTSFVTDTIKVKSNPLPQVVISNTTGCEPLAVNFNCLTSFPATYHWNFDNGLSGSGKTASTSYNAGVYNPVFTINYLNGCSRQLQLNQLSVSVSPTPSYSMTNYSGCAPLQVTFTNLTPGINTYMWYFGDGDSSTAVNPVHVYDTTGYFVATLVATSSAGCVRSYHNGWYYVNASGPNVDFRPDVTSGCAPLTVNFNNLTTGGTTWFWDFGDGNTSTQKDPSHTYTSDGLYTVTLISVNNMGCRDTLVYPVQINVSSLVVNSAPAAPVTVCAPYTVYFSDNTAASAWLWDFGDGTTSTLKNPLHTYSVPGTYVVNLTVWLANGGCSYTIQNFQTFIVDGTFPGFTYTVSSCPPYIVTFTDTTQNASGWHWSFGDGGTSTQQNPVHTYPGPGNYTIKLTVTTTGGCSSTLTATGGVSITGLGASPTMVCNDTVAPYDVSFYANSTMATSWLWDFGDGTTSTQQNTQHTYATTGPFSISLTISNDSCSYIYSYAPISVGAASGSGGGLGGPVVPTYNKIVHCAPYSVTFYSPFSNAVAWLWNFGDGTTSSLENPVHIFSDSGAFIPSLIYTDSFGVMDTVVFADTFFIAKAPSDFNITVQNSCNGIIVDVSTPGSGLVNNWDFGNGITSSGLSASHIYPNVSGNYVIRLNAVDTNGCKSYVAKSFNLDVNNPLSASTRRTCANDSISFLAGNMNFAQYLWDFGDGTFSSLKDPVHAYSDSGLFQVNLLVTDINGCTMTYPMSYNIEVFNPVASFTMLQPSGNCTWVFTRTTNTSTGADTYFWNFGDGFTSTALSTFHYYTTPGYHDITLTAYRNVCQSTYTIPNAIFVADLNPGFSYVTSGNCIPSTVSFTDTSKDAVEWFWDFGDGDTSSLQHPVHIYNNPPSSPVTLSVKDINGCQKTISRPVIAATAANFTLSSSGGCTPMSIQFADTSFYAVSWLWDFGDGTQSVLQNPSHTYLTDGLYPVTLSVTGPDGCISVKTLNPGITIMTPVAAFNADSLDGCAPMMVNFVNESSGATSWHWDFGDGGFSGNQHPQHVYAYPGIYTVTLIASNDFVCADTLTFSDYIVTRGAIPDFSMTPMSGCEPLQIQFTDLSQGAVSWEYHFGDGTTLSGQNVSHVYTDPGSFTPSLYVTDSTGCTSVFTYPGPVQVDTMPAAHANDSAYKGCLPLTVVYDGSMSVADSVIWFMGDGSVYHTPQISHVYSSPGIYQVMLIALNTNGCSDTLLLSPVEVNVSPSVNFSVSDTVGCYPMQITFTDLSTDLDNATWLWNFGDGFTDTLTNSSHVFQSAGTFDVTLIVTNDGGCADTLLMPGLITIYDQLPPSPVSWKRVNVNSRYEVQLDFDKSSEPDADQYIIYRQNLNTSLYDSIGSVSHAQAKALPYITFIDYTADAGIAPCSYKVVTVDICGYSIPIDSVMSQETVHLTANAGFMKTDLAWTPYGGKAPQGYSIFRAMSGGGMQLVGFTDASIFSFTDTTSYCPDEYTYRVDAMQLDGTTFSSSSNPADATPLSNISNQEVSVTRTTVVNNSFTLTEWKSPVLYPWLVARFYIYRSADQQQYSLIADVPSFVNSYEDYNVDVNSREYYYRITAVTECGSSDYSSPGSSIWLQARENTLHYFLKWTPYTQWNTGVEKYRIEKLNESGLWEEYRTVNGSVTEAEEQ